MPGQRSLETQRVNQRGSRNQVESANDRRFGLLLSGALPDVMGSIERRASSDRTRRVRAVWRAPEALRCGRACLTVAPVVNYPCPLPRNLSFSFSLSL